MLQLQEGEEGLGLSRGRRRLIFLAVCGLGASAIMTQLALMRELLGALAGNELVFGIILGNWLLLTGVGSYLGRAAPRLRRPVSVLIAAQLLVAVLPIAGVLAVRCLRDAVFLRGEMIGLTQTVVSCMVLLAPYCLIAGFLLTLSCRLLAARQAPESIGQVYFLDTLGDIAGGLVFTFILVGLFSHFGVLYFPAFVNLALAGVTAAVFRRRALLGLAAALAAGLAALAAARDLDALSTAVQYAGQRVVFRGSSHYGSVVVTESAGQHNFFANGIVLFTTHDVEAVEETVHYAMAQRPEAGQVLLIGGGVAGTAREVLKYGGVAGVDYVELDPLIIEAARRFVPEGLSDPRGRVRVHNTDGRLFVRRAPRRYDVVIVDVPDPSTFQINRLYTREFCREVKRALLPQGVIALSLGHYENYLSRELAGLIAVAHRTLRGVFAHVLVLPGQGPVVFLASDGPLVGSADQIAGRIEHAGVKTLLVNRSFLPAILAPGRLEQMRQAAAEPAPVNTDFNPVLYYYHLLRWMSQFKVRLGVLVGVLAAVFAAYVVRLRAVTLGVFTTGFAASTLEIVLLAGFQILCGSVYHKVGLIVTMFMLGLAIGAWVMWKKGISPISEIRQRAAGDSPPPGAANTGSPPAPEIGLIPFFRRLLAVLVLGVAVYAAALPPALVGLGRVAGGPVGPAAAEVAVPLLTLVLAVLVGMVFPLAAKADFVAVSATAARIYTADYMGACLGALLVSTLLIPLLGITAVCLIAAAVNVVSAGVLWRSGRSGGVLGSSVRRQ